ncbi:MAG: tyrosine-type recombinase/integrase [Paludisphaera borealis]|uniref:tyrosine-type recombinase/integrase n=1 Tax=Paludisphaera borealis TaxID=1387353 RepID=UPI00284B2D61|nr:tyrosine-type recombinase/integrase [Paludisphaera borealis]MDR3622651.1 tyrosine-type recombinase/integrase [Paludisphaera borealis]
MPNELVKASPVAVPAAAAGHALPSLVERAGGAARFAWEEFFYAEHHNPHTQKAYMRAVRRFLDWCEGQGRELPTITPGMVGQYLVSLGGSPAKRNLALSALRGFFDRLVNRHVVVLNPAASVKGVKDQVVEGKTPEITVEQARALLASVDTGHVVGLRDRAVLATLAYTACRAGAAAKLRLGDFQHDGSQSVLRFQEKGGKSREIPVRHDLDGFIRAYVEAAGLVGQAKDSPLFRAAVNGTVRTLTGNPLTSKRICELVKRRLKDVGLPSRLSPHSFRVAAITDLLTQGVPLEDVQYLAGHAEPRTTGLYDRRQKKVTRNIVERISI